MRKTIGGYEIPQKLIYAVTSTDASKLGLDTTKSQITVLTRLHGLLPSVDLSFMTRL